MVFNLNMPLTIYNSLLKAWSWKPCFTECIWVCLTSSYSAAVLVRSVEDLICNCTKMFFLLGFVPLPNKSR